MSTILNGAFVYKANTKALVVCTYCNKEFKYHHSTSSLKYHLSNFHSAISLKRSADSDSSLASQTDTTAKRFVQSTLEGCSGSTKLTQTKVASITKAIAYWICKDGRPMSISEDQGLENLLRVCTGNDRYTLPSRGTLKSRVDSLFAEMKTSIEGDLSETKHVGLTCDYWSSTANENYLGLTAHFVGESFTLSSEVLDVSFSEERHTADNVAKHITELVAKWKIEGKVVAMVTDNARNMTNAVDQLPYVHIGCAAHTLQLSVNKALKECNIDSLLSKVRKIVGHIKHSPANYTELKRLQEAKGEPVEALVSFIILLI